LINATGSHTEFLTLPNDHSRLATAARALGKPKLAEEVEQAHARMLESTSLYNRANLLTRDDHSPIKRHAEP
jgi:hypothetical protein